MTESMEARLLALIEGRLADAERVRLLAEVAASPELQRLLDQAQLGHRAVGELFPLPSEPAVSVGSEGMSAPGPTRAGQEPVPLLRRRVSMAWMVGAVAATLALAVPATWAWSAPGPGDSAPATATNEFLVVLHGEWPDMDALTPDGRRARRGEYWAWAQELMANRALIGAGELAPEPGTRLAQGGVSFTSGGALERNQEFVVGMFVIRAPSYEAAVALAQSSPHVRHGGSVTVRAFNTVVGFRP